MPYLMGGFPDMEASKAIGLAYADGGGDLVELGIPFSDPLADGPVIHAAATAALKAGATTDGVLVVCEALAARIPVVVMCYANIVLARDDRDGGGGADGQGAWPGAEERATGDTPRARIAKARYLFGQAMTPLAFTT